MVVDKNDSSPIFHAIEIRGLHLLNAIRHKLHQWAQYCDFLWLAIPDEISMNNNIDLNGLPDWIGLMGVRAGSIVVLKPPVSMPESGFKTGDLAKGLLLQSMRK
jgi:hypothetical protein